MWTDRVGNGTMPSLNLDPGYFTHAKTLRIISTLGHAASLYPIRLWCWCAQHRPETGILDGVDTRGIEALLSWRGPRGRLVKALVEVGFIDRLPDGRYAVHDWHQHAGHLVRYKERAKKGAQARWGGRDPPDASSNASSNASALHCVVEESIQSSESENLRRPNSRASARSSVEGGVGETNGKAGDFGHLANLWRTHKRGGGWSAYDNGAIDFLSELVQKHGVAYEVVAKAIADPARDHCEAIWDFCKRLAPRQRQAAQPETIRDRIRKAREKS